jgi:hypothetical protein
MEQEIIEGEQAYEECHDKPQDQQRADEKVRDLKPLFSCGGRYGGTPRKDEDGLEMGFVGAQVLAPLLRRGCSSPPQEYTPKETCRLWASP